MNSNFIRFNVAQDHRKKLNADIERQKQKIKMITKARERDLAAIKNKLLDMQSY